MSDFSYNCRADIRFLNHAGERCSPLQMTLFIQMTLYGFITNLSSGYEVKSLAQCVHANLVQGHAHTNDIVWFHYKPILGIQNKVACTTCSCEFGAGARPCYFSEQNLTSLPSSIMFVVLTAHILPHIEQVCLSAGGVCSKNLLAFSPSSAISNISSQSIL